VITQNSSMYGTEHKHLSSEMLTSIKYYQFPPWIKAELNKGYILLLVCNQLGSLKLA